MAASKFASRTRHGEARHGRQSVEYVTWYSMIARCEVPTNSGYYRYGARGIRVCQRWRDSYATFLADMGRRPSPEHSIDRIDGQGNYEPGNCRWATRAEQGRNRSTLTRLSCRRGHPWTPESIRIRHRKDGNVRTCRICDREDQARVREVRRAAAR